MPIKQYFCLLNIKSMVYWFFSSGALVELWDKGRKNHYETKALKTCIFMCSSMFLCNKTTIRNSRGWKIVLCPTNWKTFLYLSIYICGYL